MGQRENVCANTMQQVRVFVFFKTVNFLHVRRENKSGDGKSGNKSCDRETAGHSESSNY